MTQSISPACLSIAVPRPLWNRPTWLLVAEQGRLIIQDNQRYIAALMQARMGSHPVDHAPIVTAPAVVLDVLREAWPRSGAVGLRAFTSFRRGGFTEAADSDLTDAEIRAQGLHRSAMVLPRYAKRTMRQVAERASCPKASVVLQNTNTKHTAGRKQSSLSSAS